jgi:hypothetical protein
MVLYKYLYHSPQKQEYQKLPKGRFLSFCWDILTYYILFSYFVFYVCPLDVQIIPIKINSSFLQWTHDSCTILWKRLILITLERENRKPFKIERKLTLKNLYIAKNVILENVEILLWNPIRAFFKELYNYHGFIVENCCLFLLVWFEHLEDTHRKQNN